MSCCYCYWYQYSPLFSVSILLSEQHYCFEAIQVVAFLHPKIKRGGGKKKKGGKKKNPGCGSPLLCSTGSSTLYRILDRVIWRSRLTSLSFGRPCAIILSSTQTAACIQRRSGIRGHASSGSEPRTASYQNTYTWVYCLLLVPGLYDTQPIA